MSRFKRSFPIYVVSCHLLPFLILTILFVSFSHNTNVFAQGNSRPDDEMLVCDFVQYCSNPIVMNTQSGVMSKTNTEEDVQTSTKSTIPDVVSNISILFTPDLHNDIPR